MPEIRNQELIELRMGLVALKNYKAQPDDSPEKKAAIVQLANLAGNGYRAIKNACEAYDEQDEDIMQPFIKKDPVSGKPEYILDDKGRPVGLELVNRYGYNEAKKPLLKNMVKIPDMKPITYDLLKRADFPVDAELVALLGDFLAGEPEVSIDG